MVMAKPPLRPLAPKPTSLASRTTILAPGTASARRIADQRPVKPPPTMAKSEEMPPSRGARSGPVGCESQ